MWGFRNEKRLRTLEDTVEKLIRDLKAVQIEWDDYLHRFAKMAGRIAKSEAKIAERAAGNSGDEETIEAGAPVVTASPLQLLSLRARRVQAQIAARRKVMGGEQ